MIRSRRGFTMVELMIAIAVALVVVAGLYGVFTIQSRQFVFQDLQMEMHQNMRFATDILGRSVRIAGSNTSGMVSGYLGEPSNEDLLPVLITHDGDGPEGSDAVTVVYGEPSLTISSSILTTEPCNTTSVAFMSGLLNQSERLAEYKAGDLLLCLDYAAVGGMESYLWAIDSVDDTTSSDQVYINVADNSGYTDYEDLCPTDENLTPVMTCSKGEVLTFYIDKTDDSIGPGTPDHPVLMLDMDMAWPDADDVPLVDNVEDLQVAWCRDDGTDSVDCTDSASWTGDDETTDLDMAGGEVPWMVRISVVVRSSRKDPGGFTHPARPTLENNPGTGVDDNYFRIVLRTEVTVRNIRHQAVL